MKKYFVILGVIMLFAACDPGVNYSRIVQNDSDFDVKVVIRMTSYAPIDTLVIEKKTRKTVFTQGGLGVVNDFQNCDIPRDSIPMLIYFDNSTKLIPDINKLNEWNFKIINKNKAGGGSCECRLVLTNAILNEL